MLKRLRIQFIAIIMALLTLLLGSVIGLIYHFTRQSLVKESRDMMDSLAASPFQLARLDEATNRVNLPYCMLQVNKYGEILATNGGYYDLSDEDFLQELIAVTYSSTDMQGEIPQYHLRYSRYLLQNGQRLVFVDTTSEQATLHALLRSSLLLGAAALLLFFGVSLLLARWTVRPVESAWRQQKQFVADASHELKTPLTVILTNTELLQSPDYDEAQKQQFTDGIRTMAQQMRALVERLLELARAENARPQAAFAPVCLSEVAETSALLFEAALYERGLTLETQVEPELTVSGDERQLGQLVEILLDNARKYASGGTVRLQLQRSGRHSCHLSLENEGPALSPQQLQEIFKRFTRADPARTRSGSFGLGLAIAQAIVQAHHGKIWAESRDGCNTFHVELPLRTGREKHQETSEKGI